MTHYGKPEYFSLVNEKCLACNTLFQTILTNKDELTSLRKKMCNECYSLYATEELKPTNWTNSKYLTFNTNDSVLEWIRKQKIKKSINIWKK